jgi:predicted transcriptional regulator
MKEGESTEKKYRDIFRRVSNGEATDSDRDLVNNLSDERFYSLVRVIYNPPTSSINEISELVNNLDSDIVEDGNSLEDKDYSQVIPITNKKRKVVNYSRNMIRLRTFLSRQRDNI